MVDDVEKFVFNNLENLSKVGVSFSLPGNCRLKKPKGDSHMFSEDSLLTPLLFPVAIIGAQGDLKYCDALLASKGGIVEAVSSLVKNECVSRFSGPSPGGLVPFVDSDGIDNLLELLASKMAELSNLTRGNTILRRIR